MHKRIARAVSVTGFMLLFLATLVHSQALPAPEEPVLLVISGNLSNANVGDEVHLDLPLLESLPVTEFTTGTPWHDSPQHFVGVRLNDLLQAIGSESDEIIATGLDDYHFTITDMDLDYYPVLIAYRQNGETISVRNLGPLRIIMPFDDYPELQTSLNESRSVWQLVKLELN